MTGMGSDGGVTVAIARASDEPGVDIIDPIERRRCTLLTDGPVNPSEADPASFRLPVETAVEIETTGVYAPFAGHAYVRDGNIDVVAEVVNGFEGTFPAGRYSVDVTGLIKIYLEFDAPFTATHSDSSVAITFEEETAVKIGTRSLHTRPATTVSVRDDPADVLTAISTFGSALKTLSPERSFPTLRGHPPALERSDETDIPRELTAPVEDVRIEVPPRYKYVYPIAPLTYYLGVAADPGQVPRIVGPDIDHALSHPDGFDRAVQEVLQRVFLLDCVTRTEGYYPVDLYEREQIERRVDLTFGDLYDAPMAERLAAYLDVPFSLIEDVLPEWRLGAHVDPTPESMSMMPYLANDLAVVTMADPTTISQSTMTPATAGGFTRGASSQTRGAAPADATFVKPQGGPRAMDTAWVSDGTPIEATKAVPSAYENRFGRQPQDESISIAVVCNSADMDEERDIVDEVYGNHESMPFDVTVREELSTSELAQMIRGDYNFFHYIGHIDDDGFRCPDGRLDLRTFEDVGPEAFFLNACQSYEQGLSLIQGGAIGGIVTLDDVVNHGAIRIGQAVAGLLNGGFPLRAALDIASNRSVIGRQYVVVGDGTLSIVQPPSGTPQLYHIENTGDCFEIQIDGFGAPPGMGCMYLPYIEGNSQQYLSERKTEEFRLTGEELSKFLSLENAPVITEKGMKWSYELNLCEI